MMLPWGVVEDGYPSDPSDFRLTQFFPLLPYHSQDKIERARKSNIQSKGGTAQTLLQGLK